MKTTLILVGKTVNKHFIAGINDYVERIGHYMPFDIVTIPELKNTKKLTEQQQKTAEGELILKQLQPSDTVVLLDEHGKEMRSIEFAAWTEKKQLTARRLVYVIGGPYGFAEEVYKRANEMMSLSRMTFSHQMVRLVFVEQVYRACTIIKGEPYHHEYIKQRHERTLHHSPARIEQRVYDAGLVRPPSSPDIGHQQRLAPHRHHSLLVGHRLF